MISRLVSLAMAGAVALLALPVYGNDQIEDESIAALGEQVVDQATNRAPSAAAELASTGGEGEPVCVTVPKANLRASPTPSAKVTWVVGKHMPLERVSNQGLWSEVRDFRGQRHWIVTKSLSNKESCAVVRVRTAALHQGPGAQFPRAEFQVADKYTPFRKVDREGNWIRVQDSFNGSYWTLDSNLWIPVRHSQVKF